MRRYFEFILRHRLAVFIVCLLITALAMVSLSRAIVATSLANLFFGNSPRYVNYQERTKEFASDDIFIIGYEDPLPLDPRSLKRLEQVVQKVKRLPDVAHVESLLSAQRMWSEGDTLQVETYARTARRKKSGAKLKVLMEELRQDDQFSGTLISDAGMHAAMVVELVVDPNRSAESIPNLLQSVRQQLDEAGFEADKVHMAGFPVLTSEIIQLSYFNLKRIFPLSNLVLLVVVLVLFRRLAPALLALGVSMLSVVWSMGFSILLDREVNILMTMVPAVILIVAFSDVIHLWNAFLVERGRGKDRREALLCSASDVGRACLLTSATTFVGFVALSLIPTPAFKLVGVVLGFGVGSALLLAMTLTPLVLSLLRTPDKGIRKPAATKSGLVDRTTMALGRAASGYPWPIIAAFALFFAASITGLCHLNIETDMSQRIDPSNPYRQDQDYFNKHFSGTNTLEVFIDLKSKDGLLDPGLMARIEAFQQKLEARPEIDKVVSLVDLLQNMHRVMGGSGTLPDTRAGLAQYLLLFEMSGGEDLERLINFDRNSMLLALRLNDHGVRTTYNAGLAAQRLGAKILGQEVKVEATGLVFLIGWWLDSIVMGQRNGLLLSFVVIGLMMILGLRSLRVGLISMLPNLLPLIALGGYCGFAMDRVDSDLIGMAIMAIGIGVDDTIHFLMRYRLETLQTSDTAQAIRRTFAFSGRAIMLTTVVLVLGYLPFAMSDYATLSYMGTLLPGVFIVALLADLLLVPAMVRVGWITFGRKEAS